MNAAAPASAPATGGATARTVARAAIAVIAVALLVIQVLNLTDVYVYDDATVWELSGASARIGLALGVVAPLVLAALAIVALVRRRRGSDLFLLLATGWTAVYLLGVSPPELVGSFDSTGDAFWTVWVGGGLVLVLGLISIVLLLGILREDRGNGAATSATTAVPAGWHADPAGAPGVERWWDGGSWTAHTRPVGA